MEGKLSDLLHPILRPIHLPQNPLLFAGQNALSFKIGRKNIKLDMASNSAAYIFTQTSAADQAAIDYIRKEWKTRSDLLEVWVMANRSVEKNRFIPLRLRREHLMAIHAYTQESALYKEFNEATRLHGASDSIYQDKFHFKSFHYLLSVALDKLKHKGHRTFRGVRIVFDATQGDDVRLGQFSSTSMNLDAAKSYMNSGGSTLLNITTNWGVEISKYSAMRSEEEVLIPPIAVFKVTDVPKWERSGSKSWIKITLATKGCQGITVIVETCNGALEVNRGKGKCPENCQCFAR